MHQMHKRGLSPAIRAKMGLFEEADCDAEENRSATERSETVDKNNRLNGIPVPPSLPMGPLLDPQGLIVPRKPYNPCVDSRDRQDLHRELMFNQKVGKSVLNQKSELQRALERHKDQQVRKEIEQERSQNKSLLERAIEERAQRLLTQTEKNTEDDSGKVPEFLQVHAKVRGGK